METSISVCKHCGGEPTVVGRKKIKVVCSKCGASGAEKPLRSQAIENWNNENLVRCRNCESYHEDVGWCDIHSTFVDGKGNPVGPDASSMWTMFQPDDYCSKGVAKKGGNDNG